MLRNMQLTIPIIFKISDACFDFYLQAANQRAANAFRPATQKNHKYVMKLFIGFALALHRDYKHPSVRLVLAFVEHTAASVLSTVSTLRAILNRSGISTHSFLDNQVAMLLRAIKINKRTPAVQRSPVRVHDLRLIISQLQDLEYATHLQVAVLLLFTTSFRQSNLAPSTIRAFDPTCHLTCSDVRLSSSCVYVFEKWSKTRQQIVRDRWLTIPRVLGSALCLHAALTSLYREVPTTRRHQPLLTFDDSHPMPLSFITKSFKKATARAGLASCALTLHSLRRGGARFMQMAGVSSEDIASHAGWRSQAMFRYINNPTKPAAFKALKALK